MNRTEPSGLAPIDTIRDRTAESPAHDWITRCSPRPHWRDRLLRHTLAMRAVRPRRSSGEQGETP